MKDSIILAAAVASEPAASAVVTAVAVDWTAIIISLVGALATCVTSWLSFRAAAQARDISQKTATAVDGKMTQVVDLVKSEATAKATLVEKAAEAERVATGAKAVLAEKVSREKVLAENGGGTREGDAHAKPEVKRDVKEESAVVQAVKESGKEVQRAIEIAAEQANLTTENMQISAAGATIAIDGKPIDPEETEVVKDKKDKKKK